MDEDELRKISWVVDEIVSESGKIEWIFPQID